MELLVRWELGLSRIFKVVAPRDFRIYMRTRVLFMQLLGVSAYNEVLAPKKTEESSSERRK